MGLRRPGARLDARRSSSCPSLHGGDEPERSRQGGERPGAWPTTRISSPAGATGGPGRLARGRPPSSPRSRWSLPIRWPGSWRDVPERWQRLGLMLAILPFWTSYVVRSYSLVPGAGAERRRQPGSGRRRPAVGAPLQLANTRSATVIGFVHFFVMLLTADDLRQPHAALAKLPQGRGRPGRDGCRPSST